MVYSTLLDEKKLSTVCCATVSPSTRKLPWKPIATKIESAYSFVALLTQKICVPMLDPIIDVVFTSEFSSLIPCARCSVPTSIGLYYIQVALTERLPLFLQFKIMNFRIFNYGLESVRMCTIVFGCLVSWIQHICMHRKNDYYLLHLRRVAH